jgi:glyoxylase-like metal-dependent hydrolase (beta-lactamase superfamily II)
VGECNCAELPAGHAHAGASTAAAGASVALSPHIGTDISAPFQPLLYTAAVGPLKCNMVILGDPETKEAVLVDPGGDAEKILGAVKDLGVTITKILITHAHFDHFLAAGEVRKATGAPVCLHPADRVLWDFLPMQLRLLGMVLPRETVAEIGRPDQWLADKQLIGVLDGVCIHTPGHSEGSCCFYWKDSKLLLSGDTLFRGSVGRSDMLGGNADRLKDSILTKLYALPDDVTVITGHGEKTMIGREKRNNAHIRAQL